MNGEREKGIAVSGGREPVGSPECLAQADLFLDLARFLEPPVEFDRARPDPFPASLLQLAEHAGVADAGAFAALLHEIYADEKNLDLGSWSAEHHRLFEAAPRCPPNESAYVRRDKGSILADLRGFYAAFGVDLEETVGEKADHVVAELQFAAMLLVKLAIARGSGIASAGEVTDHALRAFVHDHLLEWLPDFLDRLFHETRLPLYRKVTEALRASLDTLLGQHEIQRPLPHDAVSLEEDSGTPYECALADLCVKERMSKSEAAPGLWRAGLPGSPSSTRRPPIGT